VIRAAWTQRIERPVEEVFDYVADLDHESEWNPDASNTVRTTPGEIGIGTVWEQDFRRAGHVVSEVDGYERPRLVSFHASSPTSEARVRFEFAPATPRRSSPARSSSHSRAGCACSSRCCARACNGGWSARAGRC